MSGFRRIPKRGLAAKPTQENHARAYKIYTWARPQHHTAEAATTRRASEPKCKLRAICRSRRRSRRRGARTIKRQEPKQAPRPINSKPPPVFDEFANYVTSRTLIKAASRQRHRRAAHRTRSRRTSLQALVNRLQSNGTRRTISHQSCPSPCPKNLENWICYGQTNSKKMLT